MLGPSVSVDRRWKRIAAACFAAMVAAAGYGNAAPGGKPAVQVAAATPARPATAKPTPAKPAPAPVAAKPTATKPAAPAADPAAKPDEAEPVGEAKAAPAPLLPPAPVSADALVLQYQRVGHELADLQAKRGLGHALDPSADLADTFHAIKLTAALATPDSRINAAAALTELHERIQRWRGVQISRECQDNPLAKDCQ